MLDLARYIVQSKGTAIGAVTISHWDRLNGIAGGSFEPNEQYVPSAHATLPNDDFLIVRRADAILTLVDGDGVQLECDTVAIIDNSEAFGNNAREVELFGLTCFPFADDS